MPPTMLRCLCAMVLFNLLFVGGCASPYVDTLHSEYGRFGVRNVGIVVWCSQYVADDPANIDLDTVDASRTSMIRADKWDKFFTPAIASQTQSRLGQLGYRAVNLGDSVDFGSNVRTADVLSKVRRDRPDIDAILLFSYVVSPFHTGASSASDGGGVSVNTQEIATSSGGNRNYSYYAAQAGSWNSQYFNSIDGLNLRGSLKLIHLQTGEVLWEIGDHSVYIVHSSDLGGEDLSKSQLIGKVCAVFGSQFVTSAANRHGIPPKQGG